MVSFFPTTSVYSFNLTLFNLFTDVTLTAGELLSLTEIILIGYAGWEKIVGLTIITAA